MRVPCADGSYAHRREIVLRDGQMTGACKVCGHVESYPVATDFHEKSFGTQPITPRVNGVGYGDFVR